MMSGLAALIATIAGLIVLTIGKGKGKILIGLIVFVVIFLFLSGGSLAFIAGISIPWYVWAVIILLFIIIIIKRK